MLTMLRRLRSRSLGRFAAVGIVAACIDFTSFNVVLLALGPSKANVILANTIAFTLATSVSFIINARYTFGAARTRRSFTRYVVIAIVAVLIYNATLLLLLTRVDHSDILLTNLAKVIAVGPSATWNFLGFALFAFGDRTAAAPVATIEAAPSAPAGPRTH